MPSLCLSAASTVRLPVYRNCRGYSPRSVKPTAVANPNAMAVPCSRYSPAVLRAIPTVASKERSMRAYLVARSASSLLFTDVVLSLGLNRA